MRSGWRLGLLLASFVILVLITAGTPCRAAQEHGEGKQEAQKEGKGHDAAGKDGHGEQKPFNPLEIAADLAIWTTVVFLLLLFILRRFAWSPILEGLRKREETIRAAIEEAQQARLEAEKARAEFQKERAKAEAQIPEIMEQARKDATRMVDEMREKASADINSDRQRLRREVETAKDQALAEIWNQAAQLATLISAKAIRRELSAEDHRRLVDEAMDEMRQQAANQRR
jgi:F-type H+-transporting ATPase subunit b